MRDSRLAQNTTETTTKLATSEKYIWDGNKNSYVVFTFLRLCRMLLLLALLLLFLLFGYGKGVLETGFQLCQTMMLCASVCVCLCVLLALSLGRPFTCAYSLLRSLILLLSHSTAPAAVTHILCIVLTYRLLLRSRS